MTIKKKVLFICTGNACRSQIAEGILPNLANDKFEAYSAGTTPSQVHPLAIKVMDEWGIDISHHTSDHVEDFLNKEINSGTKFGIMSRIDAEFIINMHHKKKSESNSIND